MSSAKISAIGKNIFAEVGIKPYLYTILNDNLCL